MSTLEVQALRLYPDWLHRKFWGWDPATSVLTSPPSLWCMILSILTHTACLSVLPMLQALCHHFSAWNILFPTVQILLSLNATFSELPFLPPYLLEYLVFLSLHFSKLMWLFNVSIPLDGKTQKAGMCQFHWPITILDSSSGTCQALHICSLSKAAYSTLYSRRAHIFWKSPLSAEMR